MSWGPGWRDYVPPTTTAVAPKRSKYGAQPHCVLASLEIVPDVSPRPADAIRFDSHREAQRFVELRQWLEAGLISHLTLQPQFALTTHTPQGVEVGVGVYRSDFSYTQNGKTVIEDVKGMRRTTDLYAWKRKHAELQYGIRIVEVR
jgi:hypothetical protein